MTQLLETERLTLRKFRLEDDGFIFTLLNSPGWLRFVGDRNIKNSEDAKNYIANQFFYSYTKFGFGPYLVQMKNTGTPIGLCCLIKREELEDVDIGFGFLEEYSGKGYAYEASLAVLNYAKKDLGINKIVAITNTDNTSSINLLKKLGLQCEKTMQFPGEIEEIFLFSSVI